MVGRLSPEAGKAVGKALEYAPHAAVGYGLYKGKQRLVDQGPLYRPYHVAKYRLLGAGQRYYGGGFGV